MIDCCVTTEVILVFTEEISGSLGCEDMCQDSDHGDRKGGEEGTNQDRERSMKTTLLKAYTFMYICIY